LPVNRRRKRCSVHQLLKANHHHLTSSHLYVLNFERYDDPHLALTLFEHASKHSPLFSHTSSALRQPPITNYSKLNGTRSAIYAACTRLLRSSLTASLATLILALWWTMSAARPAHGVLSGLKRARRGAVKGVVWIMPRGIERLVSRCAPRQASSDGHRALQERPRPHDVRENPKLTSDENVGNRFGEWPESERQQQP
jgi:hypothetical protein